MFSNNQRILKKFTSVLFYWEYPRKNSDPTHCKRYAKVGRQKTTQEAGKNQGPEVNAQHDYNYVPKEFKR